jgi:hypothetical protein
MSGSNEFEWDEDKRRSNIVKHGIDFNDATEVFDDPLAFTYSSPHATEARRVTVGSMKGTLVAVISTERNRVIRIISARVARRKERQQYGSQAESEPPEG